MAAPLGEHVTVDPSAETQTVEVTSDLTKLIVPARILVAGKSCTGKIVSY